VARTAAMTILPCRELRSVASTEHEPLKGNRRLVFHRHSCA
jgi:hypothetical protein